MKIYLNGKELLLNPETTLKQLIDNEGLGERRLAAEVNQEIITKSDHSSFILSDGDMVEIVHAIGGG